MEINVFHNEADWGDKIGGYKPGQPLRKVLTFDSDNPDPIGICEEAFEFGNAPIEYLSGTQLERAEAYRALQIRSVSVGDVVAIFDGRTLAFYACASFGWDFMTDEPNIVR